MKKISLLPHEARTHRERTGRPFVTLSYAQSLDGCIAAEPGQPFALSGSQSLMLTHKLRAAHDAILVGISTVLVDNPRLNVRLVSGRDPQPVVVDSRLRFPLAANLLQQPPFPWIATGPTADADRQQTLEATGAWVLRLPTRANGHVSLTALLEQLGELGINALMVEGGAEIITSFLSEQRVDYMVITIAPTLLGGLRAVKKLGSTQLPRLRHTQYQQLAEDLIITGYPDWE